MPTSKKVKIVGHWRVLPDGRRIWIEPYTKKIIR